MGRTLFSFVLSLFFVVALLLPANGHAFIIDEWAEIAPEDATKKIKIDSNPPAKVWHESLSGMKFIWIEGGCYKMGSPPRADGRDSDEQPVHSVCLSDFWIGKYEVTQAEWRTIMRNNPSKFKKGDSHPVERVNFDAVTQLTKRLNDQYRGRAVFSLPTEAQWEYVCREGGSRSLYPGVEHIDKIAWHRGNSSASSQATGTRLPNRLGLYDLSGNVWEWIQDPYDRHAYGKHNSRGGSDGRGKPSPGSKMKMADPKSLEKGLHRVVRGGSWFEAADALRCANRGFSKFSTKRPDIGVRLTVMVNSGEIKETTTVPTLNVLPF
jgi:formylglycine-generating enzyme